MQLFTELSAIELSRVAGVSRRTATYWRAGKVRPSALARVRLEQLGVIEKAPPRRPRRRR